MSLFAIFDIGRSGVNVSRAGVQTAGNNVTNAATPGFTRRDMSVNTRPPYLQGGITVGAGANVEGIKRTADEVLSQRVRLALSQSFGASARSEVLTRADALVGELGEATLSSSLDTFLNSFDALTAAPQDSAVRSEILEAAGRLANDLNVYAADIQNVRTGIDESITAEVERLNNILGELERLNEALPLGGADDLDRRDMLLAEIGEIADVHVIIDERNVPQVYLRHEGSALFNGSARPLSLGTDANGDLRVRVSTSAGPRDVTSLLSGGRIAGLVAARDQDLAPLANDLDQLAFDLANTVNTIHAAGYGTDGVTGRNMFNVTATAPGAALTISVDAAVAGNPAAIAAAQDPTLLPGDNSNALALAQVRNTSLSSGVPASQSLTRALHGFGTRVAAAKRSVTATAQTHERLSLMEKELTGVSIDEEMTRLMEYQRTYAAAAKIIQTVDELFDTLLSLKR